MKTTTRETYAVTCLFLHSWITLYVSYTCLNTADHHRMSIVAALRFFRLGYAAAATVDCEHSFFLTTFFCSSVTHASISVVAVLFLASKISFTKICSCHSPHRSLSSIKLTVVLIIIEIILFPSSILLPFTWVQVVRYLSMKNTKNGSVCLQVLAKCSFGHTWLRSFFGDFSQFCHLFANLLVFSCDEKERDKRRTDLCSKIERSKHRLWMRMLSYRSNDVFSSLGEVCNRKLRVDHPNILCHTLEHLEHRRCRTSVSQLMTIYLRLCCFLGPLFTFSGFRSIIKQMNNDDSIWIVLIEKYGRMSFEVDERR